MGEEYAKVSQAKLELSQIFYDLQQSLHELLHARTEILMPRLIHIKRRIKQNHIALGVACCGTALGLQFSVSTAKAVYSHLHEERLSEAFHDDAILCERVSAAAGKLADHLGTFEPHSLHDLRDESFSCRRCSLVRDILDFVPVVSIVKTCVDMTTSFTKASADRSSMEQSMKQVEIENGNIQSLLSIITKNCDFSQVHLATSRSSPDVKPASYA